MNRIVLALGVLMLPACGFADIQCPSSGEDSSLEKTVAMIKTAKSCDDADQIAKQCAWGSSADVQIAGAAGDICANTFRRKLTPADKTAYLTLINKCRSKYAHIQGTIYISARAFCEESIGKLFSDLYSPIE
jgi:3-hydroxymyristoyl/3-hydroxydecanoyl-(acyl carrier protein) dehydratase